MPVRYNTEVLPGYRVGDDGSVSRWLKSRRSWRYLKVTDEGNVCVQVGDKKTMRSVGRLVLFAFGVPGSRFIGDRVLHFPDPDPANNRIENLRWAAPNVQRSGDPAMHEYGRRSRAGERTRILTDEDAARALDMLAGGVIAAEVSEVFEVHRGVIDRLIAGSYPHLPRPPGIKPIGTRRLRGDDHPMRKFEDDEIPDEV